MNNTLIKISLFTLFVTVISFTADAQRTIRNDQQATAKNPQATQPADTKVPIKKFDSKIPIRYDTADVSDVIKPSMRNDNGFGRVPASDRTPLPYEHLRWDDALYAEKVWREIDLREKMNQVFRYQANDDNGSQVFINILLRAVNSGQVQAFSSSDDRFTTPMKPAEINALTRGGFDTTEIRKLEDPDVIEAYLVTRAAFDPSTVTKFRIKEEWIFDREANKMISRIIGIAPVITKFNTNGTERGSTVMFWVYYPDLRPVLSNYEVYNSKNMGYGRMTWEELFEARMFSSYVTRSTLDNPGNYTIRQVIKDPITALLEGNNIKERIFNYEQDLWSY